MKPNEDPCNFCPLAPTCLEDPCRGILAIFAQGPVVQLKRIADSLEILTKVIGSGSGDSKFVCTKEVKRLGEK